MPLEGLQLGNYRLQRFIGSGAMGAVYLAEDTRIARQVAVKIVQNEAQPYPNAQATADALRLFQREMRALTALDHPHILPLIDFGEQAINNTTYTYLVMPYHSEGSLVDWLQKRGKSALLSPAEVMQIVRQAADALQHAHSRQLLHLDVKPANFLIRKHADDPQRLDLLLADFGVAKFTTATSTVSQTIRGTPPYMAPEQWAGTPSAATDQYALAVMAYHLLTGRFPFEGNMQQVMYKHLQERPQPPSAFNPSIPSGVDAVILTALEKKPEDRFRSIQAFAAAFENAWQPKGAPVSSPLPPTEQPTMPSRTLINTSAFPTTQRAVPPRTSTNVGLPPTQFAPPILPSRPKKLRISRRAAMIGLIALVILGGLGFAIFHGQSPATTNRGTQANATATAHAKATATAVAQANATATATNARIPGRVWHARSSGTSSTLYGVAWSGSQFVAVGQSGTILTSLDGSNWTAQNSGTSVNLFGVAWGDSQFVAVGLNGTILTSPDGGVWTAQTSNATFFESCYCLAELRAVTWAQSQFVVAGDSTVLTSPDGDTWTAQTLSPSGDFYSIAGTDSLYVAVAINGIFTSPDGTNWAYQRVTYSNYGHVAWEDSLFIIANGIILTSPDGHNWTQHHPATATTFYGVSWTGSQFVAVGGAINTSPDGNTWTAQNSGSSASLRSVVWTGTLLVAVGAGGAILTSP